MYMYHADAQCVGFIEPRTTKYITKLLAGASLSGLKPLFEIFLLVPMSKPSCPGTKAGQRAPGAQKANKRIRNCLHSLLHPLHNKSQNNTKKYMFCMICPAHLSMKIRALHAQRLSLHFAAKLSCIWT